MTTILNVRDATNDEWDEMWQSCDYATYYHSREWAEIWQSYTNGTIQPAPKMVIFSDDIKVVLPITRQNYYGRIIKRFGLVGPPSEVKVQYGNWLTNYTLTDEHIALLSNYLIDNYRNLVWRLNPFDEHSKKVSVSSKYIRRKPFVTYMIDLTRGIDYIYSNLKKSCRNQIKQGIKNKLVISEGTDIIHWKEYYEIYLDTVKKWGSKALYTLDWKIFELLFKTYNRHNKLWLTWYNNIPIAGCICFYSHRKILIWHSASLTEYLYLRPVNLARYEIIKDGIDKNYSWLDLDTAGGNKGLQDFKKSFGPEEKMCDMIFSWHPIIYNIKKYFK
jgi:lipid II:glycine glycyltransferase (peptidoglycan interpeptide bridge formation enzyme)